MKKSVGVFISLLIISCVILLFSATGYSISSITIEAKTLFNFKEEKHLKDSVFTFTLTKNGNIFYTVNLLNSSDSFKIIEPQTKENILSIFKAVESKYNLQLGDNDILITGDSEAAYTQFKIIKQALKQKGIFKFRIIANEKDGNPNNQKPKSELEKPLFHDYEKALIILISDSNKLYYYHSSDCSCLAESDFKKIKNVLRLEAKKTAKNDLMIIIKSEKEATFKNIIDLLDEIVISVIPPKHYAEEDITEEELNCIKNYKKK